MSGGGRTGGSHFGGGRYPVFNDRIGREDDTRYMWRSNMASDFCTKGLDGFFMAYEETGDPRMATLTHWQLEYSHKYIHANKGAGWTRNVGVVHDYMNFYKWTGHERYLEEALRLFRELRTVLTEDNLFTQTGQPFDPDPPFINEDETGYDHPFPKPYMLSYALGGLPDLARVRPDEPRLMEVIVAVADFLAETQDPSGGWRYPHALSSRVQLAKSTLYPYRLIGVVELLEARGEPVDKYLDVFETALQQRVLMMLKRPQVPIGLEGWEVSSGMVEDKAELEQVYSSPEERDPSRDWSEGNMQFGTTPPDMYALFGPVLHFYLERRPAERLFEPNEQLKQMLDRL